MPAGLLRLAMTQWPNELRLLLNFYMAVKLVSRGYAIVAAATLQSSGEEQSSVSGIELRQRAKASDSDVQRAASLLKQAQRCCPHGSQYIHAP